MERSDKGTVRTEIPEVYQELGRACPGGVDTLEAED